MLLDSIEYNRIIRVFPRVCVDILVIDPEGRVLLLQRTNEPAIGQWWFPGGRVHIGETRLQAAERKLREECGISAGRLEELGSFDLFFEINGDACHDVTILFRMEASADIAVVIDAEASAYSWFRPEDCNDLKLHPYVANSITANT
jgi:colanic acid biosynthesis protein WcaH